LTYPVPAKSAKDASMAAGNVRTKGSERMPVSPAAIASSISSTGRVASDSVPVAALADTVYRMIVDRVAQDLRMRGR
jgi:hypothetical protein